MGVDIDKIIAECNNSNSIEYVKQVAYDIVLTDPYTICTFAENVDLCDEPTIMPILEKGIISFGDIVHIYEFMFLMVDCKREYFNLRSFEGLIKSSGNPKLMLYCIGFVPGIEVITMIDALYKTKCIKYISKLEEPEYKEIVDDFIDWIEYECAKEEARDYNYFPVALEQYKKPGINLFNSVLKSKDPYIYNEMADYLEYLRDYQGNDKVESFLEILGIAMARTDEPLHHYEYAASIIHSDKPMFEKRIKDSKQVKYYYYMYEYVQGVDKEGFKQLIINSNNQKYKDKIGYTKNYYSLYEEKNKF